MLHTAQNKKNRFWSSIAIFAVVVFVVFSPFLSELTSAQPAPPPPPPPPSGQTFRCQINNSTVCGGPTFNTVAECAAYCNPTDFPNRTCVQSSQCDNYSTAPGALSTGNATWIDWAGEQILGGIVGTLTFLNAGMNKLIFWAAGLFDTAITIAMTPLHNIKAIDIGWGLTRDLTNIFFIFALLIIAIATILRLESYSAKRLLVMLIVMALLTNFSLVIARTIVDASNLLGITFIRAVNPVDKKIARILDLSKLNSLNTTLPGKQQSNFVVHSDLTSALNVVGATSAFPQGQNPMLQVSNSNNEPDALTAGLFIQIIIFVFQLVAFFIFFALAVLYIIRTVALILLFVLAPFGFVLLALPATSGQAMKWWHSLFSWSMFFPISAFFLYISVQWGYQIANFNIQGNQIINSALAFNYIAVTVFLLASLLIARQMGIAGASTVIGFGTSLRKKATQYAGKGARYAGYAAGRGTLSATGKYAAPVAATLSKVPIVGAFAAKAPAAMARAYAKQNEDKEKRYKDIANLSKDALRATYAATAGTNEKRKIREAGIKSGKADIFNRDELVGDFMRFDANSDQKGMKNIAAFDPTIATEGTNRKFTAQKLPPLTQPEELKAITETMAKLSTKQVEETISEKAMSNPKVQQGALLGFDVSRMRTALERFPDFAHSMKGAFDNLTTSLGGTSNAFDHLKSENRDFLKSAFTNGGVRRSMPDLVTSLEAELANQIGPKGSGKPYESRDDFIKKL